MCGSPKILSLSFVRFFFFFFFLFFFFFFFFVFVFYERRDDLNSTIKGLSLGFKFVSAGGPMMAQTLNAGFGSFVIFKRSGTVLLRNPIFL